MDINRLHREVGPPRGWTTRGAMWVGLCGLAAMAPALADILK